MSHFKDLNNNLYWLDNDFDANLIPSDCVLITDEEAETIRQAKIIPLTYQQLRAAEYPPVVDYLDGIVKGDVDQQQAYIKACLTVKEKYPKI